MSLGASARKVTDDVAEQLHQRRARARDRPRLSKGPVRAGRAPTPGSTWWYWQHLSRLSIRGFCQAAQQRGKLLMDIGDYAHMDRGWTELVRRTAEAIAVKRGMASEPEECARVDQIPMTNRSARATFLARWFPVPRPGEVGIATWTPEQLAAIGSRIVESIDPCSTAWPDYPDGWRESYEALRGAI